MSTTTKSKQTAEERRAEQVERLEAATRELMSTDGFRRWARARSLFHNYSITNQLLIACQVPTVNGEPVAESATRVAGFHTWKKLNRSVKKGATGLRIFAPIKIKPKAEEVDGEQLETEESDRPRIFFKVVSVFDVSQTEGEPIAELESSTIETADHGELLERLEGLAGELNYTVDYRDLSDRAEGGWCDANARDIVVDSSAAVDQQVRVLTHELCHAQGIGYEEYGRERAEVIVEAAAHVALEAMGFDTSGEAVPYIAGWSARDDLATLREDLTTIDKIAARVEDALSTTTEAVPA